MAYFSQPKRCELLGNYIVEHSATVREAARYFGVSKSTVHKDVTKELRWVDLQLFEAVCTVLKRNKEERHLRGGEATRKKYKDHTDKCDPSPSLWREAQTAPFKKQIARSKGLGG